jgi:hypothetical protein
VRTGWKPVPRGSLCPAEARSTRVRTHGGEWAADKAVNGDVDRSQRTRRARRGERAESARDQVRQTFSTACARAFSPNAGVECAVRSGSPTDAARATGGRGCSRAGLGAQPASPEGGMPGSGVKGRPRLQRQTGTTGAGPAGLAGPAGSGAEAVPQQSHAPSPPVQHHATSAAGQATGAGDQAHAAGMDQAARVRTKMASTARGIADEWYRLSGPEGSRGVKARVPRGVTSDRPDRPAGGRPSRWGP